MKCALNARLLSAAELTRQDATFADIGTDHAYLPLFLLESGRIKFAVCSDINEGPLASAKRNADERKMTDKMDFILTDGASLLADRGISDYAICGMGGELIADIIERAPHLRDKGVNLILQPMSRQAHLRRYLAKSGFKTVAESYSYDAGKYYVCLLATYTGETREISDVEAELGSDDCHRANPEAMLGYLKTILAARLRASRGKASAGITDIPEQTVISAIEQRINTLSKKDEKNER